MRGPIAGWRSAWGRRGVVGGGGRCRRRRRDIFEGDVFSEGCLVHWAGWVVRLTLRCFRSR